MKTLVNGGDDEKESGDADDEDGDHVRLFLFREEKSFGIVVFFA